MIVPSISNRMAETVRVKGCPLKSYLRRRCGGEAVRDGVLKPERDIVMLGMIWDMKQVR
jgi:hypothetical protein